MFWSEKEKGTIEMIVAMVLSGTIGYFVVSSGQSFWNVVFFRCVIGAICLLVYVAYTKQFSRQLLTPQAFAVVLLGGMTLVANWLLLFASFDYIAFSIVIIAYHMQPIMLVLLSAIIYKQLPSVAVMFWLSTAVVGLWLVVDVDYQNLVAVLLSNSEDTAVYGLLLALGAAFFYTLTTLLTKKVSHLPSAVVAVIQILFGGLFLLPWVDFSALPESTIQWGHILMLGVVNTGFMYVIMYDAFARLHTTVIAILSFIYPIVALLVDFAAFDHTISLLQGIGIMLILTAVAAVKLDWRLGRLFRPRRQSL